MFTRHNLLKHAYTVSVTNIVFFVVCQKYNFLCVTEAFDSEGIINTLKRYYVNHGMR